MNAIVATDVPKANYLYRRSFIEEGIYPYTINNLSEIDARITDKKVDCLIIDLDYYKEAGLLDRIRKSYPALYIIVLSIRNDFDFVREINNSKVYGIVSKADDIGSQIKAVKYLLESIKSILNEQRYTVRVSPYEDEHNDCLIEIGGLETLYHARVKNIGRGGIAVIFSSEHPSLSILYKGKRVSIRVELGGYVFSSTAITISRDNHLTVFVFNEFKMGDEEKLYEYILDRIE